jgi:hypothetical protein
MQIPRSRFDFSEPPPSRSYRPYALLAIALVGTALISDTSPITLVAGESGDQYQILLEKEVWRAVGPALSVRFRTSSANRSAVAREAADLLPYYSAQAESAGLRYLILRGYRPIWRVGDLGLYRGWNFRYERGDDGWTASGYW